MTNEHKDHLQIPSGYTSLVRDIRGSAAGMVESLVRVLDDVFQSEMGNDGPNDWSRLDDIQMARRNEIAIQSSDSKAATTTAINILGRNSWERFRPYDCMVVHQKNGSASLAIRYDDREIWSAILANLVQHIIAQYVENPFSEPAYNPGQVHSNYKNAVAKLPQLSNPAAFARQLTSSVSACQNRVNCLEDMIVALVKSSPDRINNFLSDQAVHQWLSRVPIEDLPDGVAQQLVEMEAESASPLGGKSMVEQGEQPCP